MTQTTPEQRQRLRELCRKVKGSGARLKWETGCETMAEFANAALPAVPALLSDLDAAEAEIERLRGIVKEAYIEGYIAGDSDGGMYPDVCRRSAEMEWPDAKSRTALENKP